MRLVIQEEPKPTYMGEYSEVFGGLGQAAASIGVTFKLVDPMGNPVPAQIVKLYDYITGMPVEVMSRTSGNNGLVNSPALMDGHPYVAKVLPANPAMPVNPETVSFIALPTMKGQQVIYTFVLGQQPKVAAPPGKAGAPAAGAQMSTAATVFGILAIAGVASLGWMLWKQSSEQA